MTITHESLPRTPIEVTPELEMALNAYSVVRGAKKDERGGDKERARLWVSERVTSSEGVNRASVTRPEGKGRYTSFFFARTDLVKSSFRREDSDVSIVTCSSAHCAILLSSWLGVCGGSGGSKQFAASDERERRDECYRTNEKRDVFPGSARVVACVECARLVCSMCDSILFQAINIHVISEGEERRQGCTRS